MTRPLTRQLTRTDRNTVSHGGAAAARLAPAGVVFAACLLAMLLCGCVVDNPAFCAAADECDTGSTCDLVANRCVPNGDGDGDGDACQTDAQCSGASPVCDLDARSCRACAGPDSAGDGECASIDPDRSVCGPSGACGQCRAPGVGCADASEPVCGDDAVCRGCDSDSECAALDAAAPSCGPDGACVECTAGADCASGVCDPAAFACVDEVDVVFVAPDGVDGTACGGPETPCESLNSPLGALAKVSATRRFVLLEPGSYREAVTVNTAALAADRVTLLGRDTGPGAELTPPSSPQSPALTVTDGKQVAVANLELRGAQSHGVACSGSTTRLDLTNVTAQSNQGFGVHAEDCTLGLTAVTSTSNGLGGLSVDGGTATASGGTFAGNQAVRVPAAELDNADFTARDTAFAGGELQTQNGSYRLTGASLNTECLLSIEIGSEVIVEDSTLNGGLGGGNALSLELRDSRVPGCDAGGGAPAVTWVGRLASPASQLVVERTTISGCEFGGLLILESNFRVDNNIIVENGGDQEVGGAMIRNETVAATTQLLRHNTIANNQAALNAEAAGLMCATEEPTIAHSNLVFFASGGAPVISGNCQHRFSLVEGGIDGPGNRADVPQFVNAPNGDYRLSAGSPGVDVGDPESAVTEDFEGDPRPQGDGFDIGADEQSP